MKTIIVVFLLLFSLDAIAQERYTVFYLAIGNSHYQHDAAKFHEKKFVPFDDLPEAAFSAQIMSSFLKQFAQAEGLNLLSSPGKFLTRAKILSAVDTIITLARKSKALHPMIIVYYCGHGISENLAWNQFFVPGNYTYDAATKDMDHLTKNLVFMGDITDRLDKAKIKYSLIADCCRKENTDKSFPEAQLHYFFDNQNVQTLKTVVTGLKILNEYHTANPVIFSIEPGYSTPVVDLPVTGFIKTLDVDTTMQVGPVCRRIILAGDQSLSETGSSLLLKNLVDFLTNKNRDPGSPSAVSFYLAEEDPEKNVVVLSGKR